MKQDSFEVIWAFLAPNAEAKATADLRDLCLAKGTGRGDRRKSVFCYFSLQAQAV